MEIFGWIYNNLIYKPQLNLLEAFYHLTGDIGWSIVLLALVVNLLLWPLFGKSYVNTQKLRLLQPEIKEIQEKYKSSPQELMTKTREFYQKHKIKTSTTFLILIFQIFFATGLYHLTTALSNGDELIGLYRILFDTEKAQFGNVAFGFLDIGQSATNHLWLAVLAAIFSYFMGMYMFRWAPKPNLPVSKKQKKKTISKDTPPSPFDPEAFQKSLEFQSIYVFPFIIFITNYFLTVGVAIYFVTVNALALARQIFLINFYRTHIDKLIEDITSSDPSYHDEDPSNNLEADINPVTINNQPVATAKLNSKNKIQIKNKNQIASKNKKTRKK